MNYDEFKELCRTTWEERKKYLCIDITKRRDQGLYCAGNEYKHIYVECTPKKKAFWLI